MNEVLSQTIQSRKTEIAIASNKSNRRLVIPHCRHQGATNTIPSKRSVSQKFDEPFKKRIDGGGSGRGAQTPLHQNRFASDLNFYLHTRLKVRRGSLRVHRGEGPPLLPPHWLPVTRMESKGVAPCLRLPLGTFEETPRLGAPQRVSRENFNALLAADMWRL